MRKHFLFAGILLAALVFATPSKADTVEFTLTGAVLPFGTASFSLPLTFAPSAGSGPFLVVGSNIGAGTFFGNPYTFPNIELGLSSTGKWAFGSNGVPGFPGTSGNYFGIFAPGLFTVNPDGTITLNATTLTLFNPQGVPLELTMTVIPSPPVGTPEPATLALLAAGGLGLAALRRRKTA
jgi:PEP-CTERM motif